MLPIALTIAGSDPSGGAGIQADLKTFHQWQVYGMAVITLLTVQNTCRVSAVEPVSPELIREQLRAVLEDIPPGAAKTGALGTAPIIRTVAAILREVSFPLVVDPVMISKHGAPLIAEDARASLIHDLLPHVALVTPNLHEAEALAGFPVTDAESMERAARRIATFGPRAVLVKGGHLDGDALDLLWDAGRISMFSTPRIETTSTHGTGCTYSAAITAGLARGNTLPEAVRRAKAFVTEAIATAPGIGAGHGPLNHHALPAGSR